MSASRSRKRIRLTPFGYLVLSAFILLVLGCVYLISRAAGGASLSPEGKITGSGSPLSNVQQTSPSPDATGGSALDNLVSGASATTLEPTFQPTPTIYITPEPTTPATPSPTPAAVSRTPSPEEAANYREGKLSTGGVNLRAGPSTNDNIIGTDFAKGTKLKVYAVEGDFYFVQVVAIGKYGFISQKFVETSGITPEPIPTQIPEGAVGGRVSASTVMLRNGPGTDYTALGQFSKGTQVYVFFQPNDWAYVEIAASGEYGYMKADFIAMQSTPPSGTPVP